MQQPQPLGRDLRDEKIDAGCVAARPGKAGDKTQLDRVFADAEDDRDCSGRSFGCKRGRIAAGRSDNGHATADEVGHERRQTIVLALQPMVLDRRVLALDVAGFVESFSERSDLAHRGVRRPAADEADDRHRRLLRASRERPCGRCAPKQCDELASPHGHSLGARITPYHIVEKPCCASQHFGPPDFRNGSKAATPIRPEPEPMSAPLPKATLIQRIRHPVPDALAIAEQVEV